AKPAALSGPALLGGIDHEPPLLHRRDQLGDVVAQVGAVVALRERLHDVVERARAVAQLEHLGRGGVELYDAFGDQQLVLLAHVVVAQPRTGDQVRTRHAGCVSPRSIASSCAHSISVLKRSAATAASCCSGVVQRSTVRSSAYCASRGACTSRERKEASPAGAIHSEWRARAWRRTRIAAGPNSSVSDEATASTHGLCRAKFT